MVRVRRLALPGLFEAFWKQDHDETATTGTADIELRRQQK